MHTRGCAARSVLIERTFSDATGIIFTVFTILFCAHMLACFWFLTGVGNQKYKSPPQWPYQQATNRWGDTVWRPLCFAHAENNVVLWSCYSLA